MKYKNTRCIAIVLLVMAWVSTANGASPTTDLMSQAEQRQGKVAVGPSFRYLIVSNDLLHDGRLVLILLDKKAFSGTTLRELFKLVSKRFPDPDELHVGVYTSLNQLPTPEEEDYAKSAPHEWDPPYKDQVARYPSAVFTRFAGNEGFRYYIGNGQPAITIIMKGKDPFVKHRN